MRLGYSNVIRFPAGYMAWREQFPDPRACEQRSRRLQPGDYFPPCVFTAADRERDFSYLGIVQRSADFVLSDVRAEFILLKYYGEHCSQCVKEAPLYNRLFTMITQDDWLGPRMKMIGIGVGDSRRSVLRFRSAHGVAYPLLADERRTAFDSAGGGEIPLLYLLRVLPDARLQVLLYHEGHMQDLETLFTAIKSTAQAEVPPAANLSP